MQGWESADDDRLLGAAARDADAFSVFYRRYERRRVAVDRAGVPADPRCR
jgi:hypothetical protein